jgi:hypothetical protein
MFSVTNLQQQVFTPPLDSEVPLVRKQFQPKNRRPTAGNRAFSFGRHVRPARRFPASRPQLTRFRGALQRAGRLAPAAPHFARLRQLVQPGIRCFEIYGWIYRFYLQIAFIHY